MSERQSRVTVIEVTYPAHRGSIGLRGNREPLSWEHTTPPTSSEGDRHRFALQVLEGELLEFKLVRNGEEWAGGRDYVVHAGEQVHVEPYFDRHTATLLPAEELAMGDERLRFEVLLPPSYDEQDGKRYPVLYVLDGQALWSTSADPYGVWNLEKTLDHLFELNAIDEIIVVGIDTAERRLERLSPTPDPTHGGGGGEAHLKLLVEHLVPTINERFRTRPERENTALMGSSMGGLFSFYAAWTRPDVFGKAACLSSSFWWANREMIRRVQHAGTPDPRPFLYLDSGAAMCAFEKDPHVRDGFHHTRSMLRALLLQGYVAGTDLHRLAFTGQTHDANAWAARVAIPLQLLFPPPPSSHVPPDHLPSAD
ncbi:alpha/beta hydrolase [Chondromyces crocatus]|uniref:Esterase n=1 Tax=Chondromyces crocatus TaxID=52 RepID=A0A0K1EGY9_CHOCO|nr:alpha/beta hydrolase-fold protein [Chondromyces crocatus]AKT40109.1 uncharacterized protein CMC5_042620 [Chondromyces crocatus]